MINKYDIAFDYKYALLINCRNISAKIKLLDFGPVTGRFLANKKGNFGPVSDQFKSLIGEILVGL